LGVKSDPIEYRYSYAWLFRLMAEEGVPHLQFGTFFEAYQLPDSWFLDLRADAEAQGVEISSVFTAHRELGGFFMGDARWETVARRNYERLIEVAVLLGARQAGSNPGAVLRDRIWEKDAGVACYLRHMKELMGLAHARGLERLTIEPMSCLAEPPTLPGEIVAMAEELMAHHRATAGTVPVGYCVDVSHGYADGGRRVVHSPLALLEVALPWTTELHLKNTGACFESTFGFGEAERGRGIIDLHVVRDLLLRHAARLPVRHMVAYLEIGGPKLGRDYSDVLLEAQLRDSIRHIRAVFGSLVVEAAG
jgi:ribulose-phosphate 3-epimerase